jgi:hypothetical protein
MSLAQTDAFTEFGDHCTHGDRRDAGAALQHNVLLEPSEAEAVGRPLELQTDALERCNKIRDFATELVEDTLAKDCLLLSRTVVLICPLSLRSSNNKRECRSEGRCGSSGLSTLIGLTWMPSRTRPRMTIFHVGLSR